ncbi:MAG: aminodeoxychorismate/anthranilate synthase component II [Sphingomonas bacterium]|nr:aminodeoxychorismate/anthranilate synthase component II [Sphingomonas bacterium]
MNPARILALDNYDSFTFTLVDYLRTLGAEVTVLRNDAIAAREALAGAFDGYLISPGPGRPEDAGMSVDLARGCIETSRPLLGVCLGHQAIALACGQTVGRVPPMHGKIANIRHDSSGLFARLASPFAATRYHSLAVGEPAPPLLANAWSDDGVVMAMRHEHAPVHCVQFHPESIASEHGHALLAAFLGLCSG